MSRQCPRMEGVECFGPGCLGETTPHVCEHARILQAAEKNPPSPLAMIGGFVNALAVQLSAGNPIASQEVQSARLLTCQACPHYQPEVDGCSSCGCKSRAWLPGIDLALKRSWATSACPEGLWHPVV